jgi:hypothetical protein
MSIELNRISQLVAAEIRAELGRQEKSINDLSEAIGIPISTVRRSVKGYRAMNIDELSCTASFLNLSLVELIKRARERELAVA